MRSSLIVSNWARVVCTIGENSEGKDLRSKMAMKGSDMFKSGVLQRFPRS